ncbi:neo-calmodulin-like [Babylonia areolata]|uniref:neo-calmodulin-like n=1 Tax=Babylonia areolata TaxID=304850 RepID=UPI003FD0CDB1
MSHLTSKERELYSKVFLEMDKDGNGWLSVDELTEGCQQLGFHLTDDEAEASFCAIDANNDGKVTLDEFLAIMGHIEDSNPQAKKEAKLRRTFRDMDKDGSGFLSEKELTDGLRHNGYNVSRDQVRRLVHELDADSDGKISFEEFIHMFQL